ncbi:MAG: UbiX family flavin prenyltransferase, partial [Phycisphaeraceae bacterium]|nr:UbiX family flavin prenyltransferase [Phycisphaeraceae bacterium]
RKRLIVGITGASGAIYAARTCALLSAADVETHLVVTPLGQRLLHDELGLERPDAQQLANGGPGPIIAHNSRDVGAPIASGSFQHDGMIVVPCSANSLAAIAGGQAQHLLHRAAHVTLKERRPLVLVHRETPLSLIEIRNMAAATEAGAIVCPANPGFYMQPESIEDLVDHVVSRVLDLVDVDHDLDVRWGQPRPDDSPSISPDR